MRLTLLTIALCAFLFADLPVLLAQRPPFPFLDPSVPAESRLNDLIGRLTLEEKVSQLLYDAPAIERLQIPAYNWWNEALHGVARAGRATVFPQAIGLAATWDKQLMFDVAAVISDEARAKHHDAVRHGRRGIYEGLTFWSPNINIFRDPRWGRGMETFGEDPYLSGQLGVQFVRGMQGDDPTYLKTIATPKHYAVHSGPEPLRHVFNAVVSERDLRETYLPAFRAAVIEGGAQSVMCAYNQFRDRPCCGSDELLASILRGEWKFRGYVVSDCWALMDIYNMQHAVPTVAEAAAMAIRAGTDLNCGVAFDSLVTAVRLGLVPEGLIDLSLRRLFRARLRLGMFDPPERVAYAQIPIDMNDAPPHRALAAEAARRSIVLLKNEGDLLPLRSGISRIAVIGPNADDIEVLLGNYNGTPAEPVAVLAGIRRQVQPQTEVIYERGTNHTDQTPSLSVVPPGVFSHERNGERHAGLWAEYFNDAAWSGSPMVSRAEPSVNVTWWDGHPAEGIRADSFSVRWSGMFTPSVTGHYQLGARVYGSFRLYLADTIVVDRSDRNTVRGEAEGIYLQGGTAYPFRLEFRDRRPHASAQCVWEMPDPDLRSRALKAAKGADVVVLVMGLSPRLEGEELPVSMEGFAGGDRTKIRLPKNQEALIRDISALGTPVVLVLLNGSAVSVVDVSDNVRAIVEAWYPGQAAGTAVADVLFGKTNPGGRLPVTFYRSVEQLPPFDDYAMTGRTYRYFEGEPWYPFGFGLSYTTFSYSNMRMKERIPAGDDLMVTVDVKNTGRRAGDEVVQLYVSDLEASVPVARSSLAGFERVHLEPGQTKSVSFMISSRAFSLIDAANARVIEQGSFDVTVGGEQPGMTGRLHAPTTQTITRRVFVNGTATLEP